MQRKIYRLGEKIFNIRICGVDLNRYSIVVRSFATLVEEPPKMSAWVTKAAEVLQEYLYKITDTYIPILHDDYPAQTEKQIAIGGTTCKFDDSSDILFSDDEYYLKSIDGNLVINGGKRGLLYGVYEYLEKLGVRFFDKDCERIFADKQVIEIGEMEERYLPQFEYRDLCDWTSWNPDFSVKMRLNGNFIRKLREEDGYSRGLSGGFEGLVHTFERLLPADRYYERNPEYFALNEQGVRDPSGICYNDENALNELVKNVFKWLDAEEDPTMVSLTINDGNPTFCHCEQCDKIYRKGGNETDATLAFLNKAAKKIREKYPKVEIDTIAYGKVASLPNYVKPDKGIIIRSCATRGAMGLPLHKAMRVNDNAKRYAQTLEGLLSLYNKVYLWDYPYNYSSITTVYPILHTLCANYNFYAKKGVKGAFVNGNANVGEFTELKVYLISKLLYRPTMSQKEFDRHLEEFLRGYYGKGWRYIKRFINLAQRYSSKNYGMGSLPEEIIPIIRKEDGTVDRTFVDESRLLFEKAYRLAKTDGEKRRVKKSSLQVEYYDLYTTMDEIMQCGSEQEKFAVVERNKRLYDDLVHLGVPRVGERLFVPIVKNFKQSPLEWSYMNEECGWACDRNRGKEARRTYVMIVSDLPVGTKVNVEFTLRTNNENPRGYLGAFNGKEVVFSKWNPTWSQAGEYKKYSLSDTKITTTKQLMEVTGKPFSDPAIRILPLHLKGIIIAIEEMDSGAYVFIKDVKISKQN